jgi:hypothetical protein
MFPIVILIMPVPMMSLEVRDEPARQRHHAGNADVVPVLGAVHRDPPAHAVAARAAVANAIAAVSVAISA